ncbi:hypothetical protein [Bradyrhizobium sp. LTSP857]|uniref:hypothetical protein n=1 Tax=Bradyrhizobium sp. LTSP857 TaxID=1619231 RepID=UPI000AAAB3EC|nr:hypothetical protein [Bradyrhizobium sp. LTSP857]
MIGYNMLRVLGRLLRILMQWDVGLARLIWAGTGAMTKSRMDDPVYKQNVQRLIERNRRFEESKE